MTRRYTVRIRNPMEPHTFALRLNADGGNPRTMRQTAAIRPAYGQLGHSAHRLDTASHRSSGGHDRTTAANI